MAKAKKWSFNRWGVILLILALFGSAFYFYKSGYVKESPRAEKSTVTYYLKIEGEKDFAKLTAFEGQTLLETLRENAEIEAKGEGESAYITKIGDKEAQDSKREYWSFYVNGKIAEVGAGSYKLKAGDKIEWKIEKY